MSAQRDKGCIALDADGVLLDYNQAYSHAWGRAFGQVPPTKNPCAYWAVDKFQVERLEGDRLAHFRKHFNEAFWSSVPALPGAVAACRQLVAAGYSLVCVSALADCFAAARQFNLEQHGFPISNLITTAGQAGNRSPKADALQALGPVAFVDDYLPYLRGLPPGIHRALVTRDPVASPNVGPEIAIAHSQHKDLQTFVEWWLRGCSRPRRQRMPSR